MIHSEWLGQIDYGRAWVYQKKLVAARNSDPALPDQLLLLEHPPTYTCGRRTNKNNLLLSDTELAAAGITVYDVDRGGDITYHGPGQLVAYPIFNLMRLNGMVLGSVRPYVGQLEEVIINTLTPFGLHGWRYDGYTGVWLGERDNPQKVAAIGVHINSNGITSHGFALNVNPNLTHFQGIVPCGIAHHGVTSMVQELQRPITVYDLLEPVTQAFATVFEQPVAALINCE